MTFGEWQTWVFLGAIAFIALDHFRLRSEVVALRLYVAESVLSKKEAEKIEKSMGIVVERLDKITTQLARMEGAMGVPHSP
jgi:hypothetical protein